MLAEPQSPTREVLPDTHRIWLEEQQDGYSKLEKRFFLWIEELETSDELFKKHIYENPDLVEGDLRQHRLRIHTLMAHGEKLALGFMRLGVAEDTKNYISRIDEQLRGLWNTLHAWHGPMEEQKDIPESFKRGLAEIEAGKVVDMERALNEKP
jgi:hypothetical protein